MGIWTRLQSFIFGGAVATAAADAVRAVLEVVRQHAWQRNPVRVLQPGQAAELVTQGLIDRTTAEAEAAREGYNSNRLAALVELAYRVPGVAELMRLWRRGILTEEQWREAMQKTGLRPDLVAALEGLKQEPIDPAEIAKAIHRGIMHGAGLLVSEPSTTPGKVPIVPPSPMDPEEEAAWSGLDHERLRILVGNAGLPPGVMEGLSLLNRGKITEDDFSRLVGESNMRNEWADALLALRRQLLTPHEYAELRVRGWIDDQAMLDGAALHGMTEADTRLLFEVLGRPIPVHQVTTGEARGGTYDGDTAEIPEAYLRSLEQGSQRPEWYSLSYHNRFTLPSAFVIRALQEAGAIDGARAEQLYLWSGWPPALAQQVAQAYAHGAGGTTKAQTKADLLAEYEGGYISQAEYQAALEHLGYTGDQLTLELELGDARRNASYRTKVVEAIHAAYLEHEIADDEATQDLASVMVTGTASQQLIALWNLERRYTRTRLTEAQVVKAYKKGLLAEVDALARLADFGLNAADAQVRLQEG